MENVPIPPERVKDPPAVNQPEIAHIVGRDPERTPMQWDDSIHAGFAAANSQNPWLPLAANYREVNVAHQSRHPTSFLSFFRTLTAFRQGSRALTVGDYHSVTLQPADAQTHCFVFERWADDERLLIALNFSGQSQRLSTPLDGAGRIVLSTEMDRSEVVQLADFTLRANEGCVITL